MGAVVVVALAGFLALALTGKPIRLPVWAVAETEQRINLALGNLLEPGASVALGGVEILVDEGWTPRIRLSDLELLTPRGAALVTLPQVRVILAPLGLVSGRIAVESLRISGAQITLRRLEDGRLNLVFGAEMVGEAPANLAELLDRVEAAFANPALAGISGIEAEGLTLTLDDRRANRVWQVGDGRITLQNRPDAVALSLGFGLVAGGETPARAELTFISDKASPGARMSATIDRVAARDLALQAPALGWLGALEAPISGRISAIIDAGGGLASTEGRLEIGAGALRPNDTAAPVPFERAGFSFAVDTGTETVRFDDLSVASASLRLNASGTTRVGGLAKGRITSFVSQVAVADLLVDPEGLFTEPVRFGAGAADLRLTLDPFRIEIGQIALTDGDRRLNASGLAEASPEGWTVAMDLTLNEIAHDGLLALWPVRLVPKTRAWLEANVQEGLLANLRAAVRLAPKTEPRLSLGYEFENVDVRFLRTLPPIRKGHGYSTILDQTYTIWLDEGEVTPPAGGRIDVAGSVFQVADITQKPATAEITLRTNSTITAAMSLLDEPPFRFLSKAGFAVDVAEGRAVTEARLTLPLRPKVQPNEVAYSVTGTLTEVSSDRLVKGRSLTADRLSLSADRAGITLSGPGRLGRARFDATWTQAFGPAAQGRSRVAGTLVLSDAALEEFAIRLPEEVVRGRADADMTLDLVRGGGGAFRIASDLAGLRLRLPAIGLAKATEATGALLVEGRLGAPAAIDRLTLDAAGVTVEGSVSLRAEGGLDRATFDRVESGDWLDASVEIAGTGPGSPVAISVTGGSVDLRTLPPGGSGGGDSPPLDIALDRLTVTEGIAMTDLRGTLAGGSGGPSGEFTALVNGAASVRVVVAPAPQGTAARILSDDAGAVLAAAGLFRNARGGSLDLTLWPEGGRGIYDGEASVRNVRVVEAPALAALLNAISVVGLIDEMSNAGILFSAAEAVFRTSPNGVSLSRGSAVGASLGVSMSGTYTTATRALDMQGVISPVYLLNGIGSILTRPGEGLFGFNYDLTGSAAAPQVSVNPLSILTPGMFRELFRIGAAQPGASQ